VKAVPSAAAALAVAAPLALAGLPGPSVLTLGISGAGAPRAGHSYTYLVSVGDPARAPAWLVHLAISAPGGTTVIAAGGGAGACRVGPGGADCVWPQLTGGSAVGVSVTVSLGSGLRAGTPLAATARLSYDWGQLSDAATSVRTVAGPPPRPRVKPKPRPRPKPKPTPRPTGVRHTPPPRSVPSSPPRRLASSPPPRVAVTLPSPPSRVSPLSPPSQPTPGSPVSVVRPHRVAVPSRTPRPRPSRSPSPGALFPRTASKLIVPPPSLPAPGLPKGLLIALIIAPCVAAAVTRFARGR
jgi:hypothetical protein